MRFVACGRRSSDFGVMMISGRCLAMRAWRRSRWKYCAGVVRFADADVALGGELQEALEAAPRSARGPSPRSRAAAAASGARSGPTWPGRETMNWSMMTCAPLTKSPNCASQSTSVSGASAL